MGGTQPECLEWAAEKPVKLCASTRGEDRAGGVEEGDICRAPAGALQISSGHIGRQRVQSSLYTDNAAILIIHCPL